MRVRVFALIMILMQTFVPIANCCAADTVAEKTALCGPLSANFVIHYYRGSSDLVEVVEHCGAKESKEPISLLQIKRCLQRYGVHVLVVRLPVAARYFAKSPVILHSQKGGGHFVVLLPDSNRDTAAIYEPGVGVRRYSWIKLHEESPDYALVTSNTPFANPTDFLRVEHDLLSYQTLASRRVLGAAIVTFVVGTTCCSVARRQCRHFKEQK